MHNIITVCGSLAFLILSLKANAQMYPLPPQTPNSHQAYIQSIQSAQDSLYQQTLRRYDHYLSQHPDNIATQIEKCRFIERAFYGEENEYNPKQDEFEQCLADLCARFSNEPSVLMYQSEHLYGDSAIAALKHIVDLEKHEPALWRHEPVWQVYQNLALQYSYQEGKHEDVIAYAEEASRRNDTLDLTLLLARQYKALSQDQKAFDVLKSKLNWRQSASELNQKAELLLELKQYDAALATFNRAQADTSVYINFASLGKTLEEVGRYSQARQYLLKDTLRSWLKVEALKRVFLHDLKYQPAEQALASYNRLRDQGFSTDPFSIQRLRLFFRHPLLFWQWRDLQGIAAALLLIAALLLVPYVLILPIHYLGLRKKHKGWSPPSTPFRWGLRHFWYVTFFYLLASYLVVILYAPENISTYFSETPTPAQNLSTEDLANSTILFIAMMAITTAILLRPVDLHLLRRENWSGGKVLLIGGVAAVGMSMSYSLFRITFQPWLPTEVETTLEVVKYWVYEASIKPEILAINQQYGVYLSVLLVAGLVPVYEEIIFRGIVLSSCEKHLSFVWANLIQATLFALVHEEVVHFFFFFGFGLLAGFLRRRSNGLSAGIVFHGINNFYALMLMLH